MRNQIRKADVDDIEFLDAEELQSDGSFVYLTSTVVSTTSGTKTIVIDMPADGEGIYFGRDHLAQAGDIVILSGTSGGTGDGQYTIASVVDDLTFTVVQSIGTSTGGSVNFYYVPGAKRIGFDPTGLNHVMSHNVQNAIKQLDNALDAISDADHEKLRQLIHLADEGGPFEGFTSGVYQETTPAATPFPTSVIWWNSSAKVGKIVEETITYNSNKTIATDNWKAYDVDGSTLLAEITDVISYSGVFETSRTRTITSYSTPDPIFITEVTHRDLRQLIHLAEEGGPFEGFASGAYQEILPAASPFPTSVIWWVSSAKTSKIVEETITYNPNQTVATDEWKVYATNGTTVLATVTDSITYSGVFELSRIRSIA